MESSRIMRIYIEGVDEEFMLRLKDFFAMRQIKVLSLQRRTENRWYKGDTYATIVLDIGKSIKHRLIIEEIRKLEGLRYVEEI